MEQNTKWITELSISLSLWSSFISFLRGANVVKAQRLAPREKGIAICSLLSKYNSIFKYLYIYSLLCIWNFAYCILICICALIVIFTYLYSIMSHIQSIKQDSSRKLVALSKVFTEKALLKGWFAEGYRNQRSVMKHPSPPWKRWGAIVLPPHFLSVSPIGESNWGPGSISSGWSSPQSLSSQDTKETHKEQRMSITIVGRGCVENGGWPTPLNRVQHC